MRILITGGFGFVGGRVARQLYQAGHQIILASRNPQSAPDWLPQAQLAQTDWNNGRALEQICSGVDVVIQAAGMNAQDCAANPVAALEFNGLATARMLEAACRTGVKKFIYLSSAHVYASPLVGTITEDTCPRNLHPYATSHLAGENAVLSASQRGQIEGIVLRLSNAFGAPVHPDVNCWMLLLNDLCRQTVETGKMVLHSSGMQQRDFIAMTEVCRVVEYFSSGDSEMRQTGIFNLGSGVSISVLAMAQLVQQRCKHVLGFEPDLQRPEAAGDEPHEMLTYRSGKLERNGLNVGTDKNLEIDGLLEFCQESYHRKRSESV